MGHKQNVGCAAKKVKVKPAPLPLGLKHQKGKAYTLEEKTAAMRLLQALMNEDNKPYKLAVKSVSKSLGFSERAIRNFNNELKKRGGLISNHCPIRNKPSAWDKLKPDQVAAIRSAIHDQFRKVNERGFHDEGYPTAKTMHKRAMEIPGMLQMGIPAFRAVLAHMGFKFRNRSENSDPLIVSDPRIVKLRENYLKRFMSAITSGRKVYFSDETYVHQFHTVVSL